MEDVREGYINVSEILKAVLSKKKLFLISIPIAILFMFTQKFYVEGMSGAVKG